MRINKIKVKLKIYYRSIKESTKAMKLIKTHLDYQLKQKE